MSETYIGFRDRGASESGKTRWWVVCPKDDESGTLGWIKWFGRWRCYAFYPVSGTVFEKKCLRDIAAFCEQQTESHCKVIVETRRG